jgi:hypothetical protein
MRFMQIAPAVLALALAGIGPWVQAATIAEVEPNNSCAAAQSLGERSKVNVSGEITTSDVDYFSFTGTPGKMLQVDLSGRTGGGGTIIDTLLGAFDSHCQLIGYNDYGGNAMDSLLVLKVPADGIVTLAAAGYPDFDFTGAPGEFGTYTLQLHEPTSAYVKGVLTDASSGQPLPVEAAATVSLMHCPAAGYAICPDEMFSVPTAADGSYVVSMVDIEPGYYQLRSTPANYGYSYSKPFELVAGATAIKLNLKAQPLSLQFGNVQPCASTSAAADCSFSYTVSNTGSAAISADVWASVDGYPTGASYAHVVFSVGKNEARKPSRVDLAPGASTVVTQLLPVAKVPSGVMGVVELYASKPGKPGSTIGHGSGFAFTVTAAGTSSISGADLAAWKAKQPGSAAKNQHRAVADSQPAAALPSRTISGTLYNALTQTPLTDAPYPPYVNVYGCTDASYSLCTTYMGGGQSSPDGSFSLVSRDLVAGHYQLWATTSGFQIGYSKTFDYNGKSVSGLDIDMAPLAILLSNVQVCAQASQLPAGSECGFSYDIHNAGPDQLSVDVWAGVHVEPTGSVVNASTYSSASTRLTLKPGETINVQQALPVVPQLAAGAMCFPSIWVSAAGKPFKAWASELVPTISVVPAAP